jgi:CheY-like chemotaxis protein
MNPTSRRVLIADDEPHILALLSDFLTGQGYEVSAVATGAEALDAVPVFRPESSWSIWRCLACPG